MRLMTFTLSFSLSLVFAFCACLVFSSCLLPEGVRVLAFTLTRIRLFSLSFAVSVDILSGLLHSFYHSLTLFFTNMSCLAEVGKISLLRHRFDVIRNKHTHANSKPASTTGMPGAVVTLPDRCTGRVEGYRVPHDILSRRS